MARWDRKDFDCYCETHCEDPRDAFHEEFWRTLVEFEEILRLKHSGKNVRASRTWMSVRDNGAIKTTAAHALRAKPTQGFLDLIKAGKPENTDEYFLLKFREQVRFCERAVKAAEGRLNAFGISVPTPQPRAD